jgi:hypothetical protein
MDESDQRTMNNIVVEYIPPLEVIDDFESENIYKKFNTIDLYEQESVVYKNDFAK